MGYRALDAGMATEQVTTAEPGFAQLAVEANVAMNEFSLARSTR
jgi:hypothetical protein